MAAALERNLEEPIVVTGTKVSRLADIAHARIRELGDDYYEEYSTTTKSGKQSAFDTLELALAVDNPIKNPVVGVTIKLFAAEDKGRIVVAYGSAGFRDQSCHLYVTGDDPRWVIETFAELEEQVERIRVGGLLGLFARVANSPFMYIVGLCIGLVCLSLILAMATVTAGNVSLSKNRVEELHSQAEGATTLDEKVGFLFASQRAAIELERNRHHATNPITGFVFSKRGAFVLIPILVGAGALAYVVFFCCPYVVFRWGDWEEHYERLVKKRNFIGGTCILAFAIGVVSSLTASSLLP